jgi:serine/threonine protein kinase/Flp pilus assembly protein TadD
MNEPRPQTNRSWSPALARRIEQACNRFEAAYKADPTVKAEDFLGDEPEPERSALLRELLARELECRRRAGEFPGSEEYLARFPGQTALVRACFDTAAPPSAPGAEDTTAGPRPPAGGPRYRILRPHARGGLGQVSVARDEQLRREVALKEIRPERGADPGVRQRFLAEAEITGQLQHPGVVPVYALEEGDDGRPHYAMRFVEGKTLAEAIAKYHAAPTPLAFRDLLQRFVSVCRTVAYAHSQGVLHRDLKPANVMLGDYGETLVVDWGLAKRLGRPPGGGPVAKGPEGSFPATVPTPIEPQTVDYLPPGGGNGGLTEAGQVLGTPAYMAPEAAAGRVAEIGPAADVYALGAILYELLTGRAPYRGTSLEDVLGQVRQGPPAPPSGLRRGVPRALEAVCLKAMARAIPDRYAGAAEMAGEVDRWLADEPVAAYREPLLARLARWGRRHRPVVAGAAVLLLTAVVALAAGIVAVNHQRDQKEEALAAETKRRAQARAALDAMSSLVIGEWLAKQKELLPEHKKFLRNALAWYEEFAQDTRQDEKSRAGVAEAFARVGQIRLRLGQAKDAEAAYRRSQELYAQLAADSPNRPNYRQALVKSHNGLGSLLNYTGRPKEAEKAYRTALALSQELAANFSTRPEYSRDLAMTQTNLGSLLKDTDRFKEAKAAYDAALALYHQLAAKFPKRPDYRWELAIAHNNLGLLLADTGRFLDAEAAYRATLGLVKRLAAEFPNQPDYSLELASTYNNLGRVLGDTGRPKRAEKAFREAIVIYKELVAGFPNRPGYREDLATSYNALGALLWGTGRPQAAETPLRQALVLRKQLAADFTNRPNFRWLLADSYNNLGVLLQDTGRPKAAETAYRAALKLIQLLADKFPKRHIYRSRLADGHNNVGTVLQKTGRLEAAEAAYRKALALRKRLVAEFSTLPDYQNDLAISLNSLADLANARRKYRDACRLLAEALPHCQAALRANSKQPFYRSVYRTHWQVLAEARLGLGEHAAAAAATQKMLRFGHEPVKDGYNGARFLALCVALADKDTKLPEGKRRQLARAYGERAMAQLRQAVAKGYKDVGHMKQDKDLDSLRSRMDFQKLLAKLEREQTSAAQN